MRTIAHISDLHFGAIRGDLVCNLRDALLDLSPNIVAVSGDLTQRARRWQFVQAAAFLASLPFPLLTVPGNHDMPLYNLYRRWTKPLAGYRRAVGELPTFYEDGEMALVGMDTTKPFGWKEGRFSRRRFAHLASILDRIPEHDVRIVVAHHPLPGHKLATLTRTHPVDMVLTGHHHIGRHALVETAGTPGCLTIHAGTAVSRRLRGQTNSFNLLRVERNAVEVDLMLWEGGRFELESSNRFVRVRGGWRSSGDGSVA
ncbi:metallophosphoesterase family protein [Oceanidesulfovibrio marinus]|uniref:Metallophosphoesterase n=1 Tax=Oceanidesulfovibrio marinus TaxID=370038 RepID=A0A6P1ZLL2_9BACT|nr:metallophosphoesterase [Oceanidesulfovibrio marinus]QJT08884.1 metallophosphoesterase [Oceanidesulfovibrio marinus]TVM36696.1 metallophosphoesterase [Oceanidesulfovibrio marinus]